MPTRRLAFRRLVISGLPWLLFTWVTACVNTHETLELRVRSGGTLEGGETKTYQIACGEGEVIDLRVDQRGVDAVVTLKDPEGNILSEVDGFFGASGQEMILELIPASGTCTLDIRAPAGLRHAGEYSVLIEKQQPADLTDRERVHAADIYWQGFSFEIDGEFASAIDKYEESLALWIDLGDEEWQSVVHYTLGQLYANKVSSQAGLPPGIERSTVLAFGQLHKPPRQYDPTLALEYLNESLELSDGAPGLEARAYFNLGAVHSDLLHLDVAQEKYEAALPLWIQLGDRTNQAATLNDLGVTHQELGELQTALRYYNEAIVIWQETDSPYEAAIALYNRGVCYTALDRTELASADLERALEIWTRIDAGDAVRAVAFTAMGWLFERTGRLEDAHDRLRRALELSASNPLLQAKTRLKIGAVYFAQGDRETADELYKESLEALRAFGDKRGETAALLKLGELREESNPDQALELHDQVRRLSIDIGSRELHGQALFGMARAERHLGNLDRAKLNMEEAIEKVESIRNKTTSNELRSVFFASKQQYYTFYVDLLMELADQRPGKGYEAQALSASERSRARTLLDLLHDSGVDLRRGDSSDLLEKELKLEMAIEAKYIERETLLSSGAPGPTRSAEHLSTDLLQHLQALDDLRSEIRLRQPAYAELTHPQPMSTEEIQLRLLDEDTMLLEYHLGEPHSYLFVVSKEDFASFRLSGRGALEEKAQRLHDILTDAPEKTTLNRGRLYVALEDLSEEILQPATEILDGKRLLIVAGGALQYVPFSALPLRSSSDTRLVDDHEIAFSPSASILSVLRDRSQGRSGASRNLAVWADPVFLDDPRMPVSRVARQTRELTSGSTRRRLGRLTYSRHEARNIIAQAGGENKLALDFDATKEEVLDEDLRHYKFIHFATHSIVDTDFPDLSSLVFTSVDRQGHEIDSFLRIYDVYKLSLQAEMVVLSACKTASGKEIRGEGLVGWTHGFMYSGARRVLVSLWDVDDEATAELMKLVYTNIFKSGLSPASALQHAQATIRQRPRWREPYFWAGFVLQGEFL